MRWSVRIARSRAITVLVVGTFALSIAAFALPVAADAPDAVCPAQTGWLAYLNTYRSVANIPTVNEDTALETGDCNHSRYVVKNSITHVEDPGNAWYTASGAYAGQHSNVAVQFGSAFTYQDAIDEWMTGPFHETGMLDPRLTQSGLGIYAEGGSSGATLDVLSHLNGPAPSTPTYFPANNKQMTLRQYGGSESPDPLSGCGGYTAPTGPPLSLQLLTTPAVTGFAFSKVGAGNLSVCEFDETNYTNPDGPSQTLARQILGGRHAIILMPQSPLTDGTYQVTVVSNGTTYNWTFTVGAVIPPSPNARPVLFRSGTWFFRNALTGGSPDNAFSFGAAADTPLSCDADGNGSRSPAIVRPTNGSLVWYTRASNTPGPPEAAFLFGSPGDTPLCGDWDGNGTETPGLARVSGGSLIWILSNSANGSGPYTIFAFGGAGDTPVVGDWNGDKVASVGIVRSVGGSLVWYLRDTNSGGNPDYAFGFGGAGDTPVVGDWTGSGKMSEGIVRGAGGGGLVWYWRNSLNTGPVDGGMLYGAVGDVPLIWIGSGVNGQAKKKP